MQCEPAGMIEYLMRFKEHERITGMGIDTTVHAPCPFCGAPDFWVYRILDIREIITRETICSCCQRGAQTLLSTDHNATKFEVIQTSGPTQPAWLQPKLRRLTNEEPPCR